ncbi:Na+/H+ antiporter [Spirosoma sp. KCTC 42546]|uniref:Na+/H+ antiporter n=1 Tax=Spirosoma sp. KCTC 42546 TaxID=2520506 RepID=UPI0011591297|nr:Na+/H+ antiporter [Spirosoma sp. KCTC 42546]QDK82425.1 Na+/H+ antiporter [Spirosoma sp. KCTC 42546]
MENYSIILFLLAVMIGLSAVADKIKLPYPILMVTAGIAVGFIPGMPKIEIDPDVVFLLFLPPMLYDAAFNISWTEFKKNINTISSLAFALVFLTASGIAITAYFIIPGMTWPLAFVLGAILSATDAVAAMSITKGLGLSHKTLTILEGESLINDASGLIAYRLAVAAVAGSSFVFWKAGLQFLLLIGGGFAVGWVLGNGLRFILKQLSGNKLVAISFTLLMPFIAYSVAEELHVSGVIAVVTLGLIISQFAKKLFPDGTKAQSKAIWEIIVFILNGLVFVLIGLEFPYVLDNIDRQEILPLIGYSFLVCLVALAIRMARVFLQKINIDRAFRKTQDSRFEDAQLDWKNCLIISWSGMRGIVSLATAIALPVTLADGQAFPQRDTIIFIAVVTVLITLVGQGLSLPMLVKRLGVTKDEF